MNRSTLKHTVVFAALVSLAVGTRLLMLAPNVHAVTAAALFAGFYFSNRAAAACVPLVAMFASDWVIGGYATEVMATVYAALLVPIAWRALLRARLTAPRVMFTAATSSVIFFLATNAAVWHASSWYPRGWEGLMTCYASALPFLWYSLAGDVAWSGLLFGAYALAIQWQKSVAIEPATV